MTLDEQTIEPSPTNPLGEYDYFVFDLEYERWEDDYQGEGGTYGLCTPAGWIVHSITVRISTLSDFVPGAIIFFDKMPQWLQTECERLVMEACLP